MIFTRKAAVGFGIAALASAASSRVRAADTITLELGTDNMATHPLVARTIEAAAKTKSETAGRLDIKVFPNSALGGQTQMLGQLRLGALPLALLPNEVLGSVVQVAGMENIPFVFADYKQAFEALDGQLGANLRAQLSAAGIFVFDKLWCSGFKQVTTSQRAINTPADLKGLKLRIPSSPVEVALWKAFDCTAVPLNFGSETYTAIQSHLVDGMSVPIVPIETSKYYEILKYLAITNHIFSAYSMTANADVWKKLPEELRTIAERNFVAAATQQRLDMVALDTQLQTKLREQGMSVTRPDLRPFRAIVKNAGLYAQWRDHFGASNWAILEKAVGNLT